MDQHSAFLGLGDRAGSGCPRWKEAKAYIFILPQQKQKPQAVLLSISRFPEPLEIRFVSVPHCVCGEGGPELSKVFSSY